MIFAAPFNPIAAALGMRLPVAFNATSDIRQPFNYCTQPTRISAAYSNGIYRMCIPTIIDGNVTTNDYWFDTKRMRWNGPHTFVYDTASSAGGNFVLSGAGSGAKLFYSYTVPSTNTVYNDNGASYLIDLKTADFPNTGEMAMNQIVESTIALASSGASQNFSVSAFDDAGNYITSTNVKTNPSGSLWGSNYWGDGSLWKSSLVRPQTYLLAWPIPIVFNRIAIEIVATAGAGVAIDSFFARTQKTGYTLQSFGFDIYDLSWLQDRDYRTLTDVAKRHFMRFIADEIDRFTYVLLQSVSANHVESFVNVSL